MHDERLDAAIDEAARLMTAGEPSPGFRERVLERIESTFLRRSMFVIPRSALAAAGALAAIVAAIVVFRGSRIAERPENSSVPARAEVRLPPSPQRSFGGPGKADVTSPSTTVRLPPSLRGGPTGRGKPDAAATDSDSVFDLGPLVEQPIAIESIAVATLPANDSIQIEPLQPATPIAVTPLGVESQGDRR